MDQIKWILGPLVLLFGQLGVLALAIALGLVPALLNSWWQNFRRDSLDQSSGIVVGCIAGFLNLILGIGLFIFIGYNVITYGWPVVNNFLQDSGFHNTWGGPVLQALDFLANLLDFIHSLIFGWL